MSSNTPKSPSEFVETMIRSAIEADRLVAEYINDTPLRQAETQAAVNGFVAAVALENLHRFAPDAAKSVAQRLDQVLTAGDIGGPAYRAAKALDHDPDQWITEFEKRAAIRKEKKRATADRAALMERVVVQHIADGQMSGSPAAAALAQSLLTELDAAGLDFTAAVNAHYGDTQADDPQPAAGEAP